MTENKKVFWLLVILSTLVILPFLGETIFYTKGEPREAIVAYTMLEQGNWILPLNYGTDIAYKPPFLYWCIACFSALFGGVSEFSSRLPSALAFLAMLWTVYSFFAKRKGVRVAFLTSLLLLTSFEVHRAATACRVDMLQVSFIVISLLLLFRWDEEKCRRIPWLAIVLMAAASLTKGPVGSIFPCLVIGVYQLMQRRPFFKTFFSLAGIGLLSLLPLAGWYYAAYLQGGEAFVNLMLEENTGRFAGTMSYASHENPISYNFLSVILGWLPWTLVLVLSLFFIRWRNVHIRFKLSPVQLFTWLVIIVIFVFYCIPKSKRSVYLLPIYPFMAVLIAEYLLALASRGVKLFKLSAGIFLTLCLLLTFTFLAVRMGLVPDSLFGTGRHAAENVAYLHALQTEPFSIPKWILIALPVIAALCTGSALRKKAGAHTLLYNIAGCMLCIFVALDGVYQPAVLATKSDKELAARVDTYQPTGFIYSYEQRLINFYCVNFYLNDRMRHIMAVMPVGEGYVLVAKKTRDEMFEKLANDYTFEEVFLTEKRSCDLRDNIYLYKFKRK
jgi:4-amino-4-deoxy-L-arabinose transferase-like glycosyltransferase